MKVIHVANFSYNQHGSAYYNCDRKISAGFVRNGHFVYDFSLRDIARTATIFKTKKLGIGVANKELVRVCQQIEPDLLLLGHAQLLQLEALQQIKQLYPTIKVALWYVDPLFHLDKIRYMEPLAPYLDAVFATTGGEWLKSLAKTHNIRAFIPNPVEKAVESGQNFKQSSFRYELVFCGTVGDDVERHHFMASLKERLRDLPLAFCGLLGQPTVTGINYIKLLTETRMGLNYSRRNDITLYSSDRIAQLTGNGLLTFSPRIPEFDKLYKEDELVYFDSLPELIDKVRYFSQHPAEAAVIAERGWQRAHTTCATERICRFMTETIFQQPYSESYEWLDHVFPAR